MTRPNAPVPDRSTRPARAGRLEWGLVLTVVTAAMVVGALRLTPGHDWGDDFASYVMQAQSLRAGDPGGFVERNGFTIRQSSHPIGPVAYPWGYPLLLVTAYAIAGLDPLVLKVPGLLLFGAFLVTLHLLVRTGLGRLESLVVLLLFAFHPDLLAFLDQILSDVPFLFFSTLGLLLMERMDRHPAPDAARGAWLGAVLFAAFFTRTVGLLLLAVLLAPLAWSGWRRGTGGSAGGARARAALVATATFGLLWLVSRLVLPTDPTSYLAPEAGMSLAAAWKNAGRYAGDAIHFLAGPRAHPGIAIPLALAAISGGWARRRENSRLIAYLGLTVAVVLAWPAHQGLRFLFPVLPVLVLFTVVGLRDLAARLPPRYRGPALAVSCAAWLAVAGIGDAAGPARRGAGTTGEGPFDAQSAELFRYVRDGTRPDSVIVFFKPRALRLLTGRAAFTATDCTRAARGNYLVLHKGGGGGEQPGPDAVRACGAVREVTFENATFVAHRIR